MADDAAFFDLLNWVLPWRSAVRGLADVQKTLGGEPIVTLYIGAHELDDFVWGYRYEEEAKDEGGLTLWLDNRGGRFDDLANDYPDLVRGAAIDLRRGLMVRDVATVEKLPRTWIEGLSYVFIDGAALLRLDCIDWRGKLRRFRYASETSWSSTEAATIASSILGQVGLTLASGTWGFTTDLTVSPRRDGDQALNDLMDRVDEYLYAGADGEIQHKSLNPAEAAGYNYDWSQGGGNNHPCMHGTEIAESAPRYNKVTVIGGSSKEYTGSAEDSDESTLMGTRLRTITDKELSSNAQCTERAQAELRFWQAQASSAVVVARPHFTLRMFTVVTLAAPPWGGPGITGRVRGIVEEYGRGVGLWQQRVDIGGMPDRALASSRLSDGAVTTGHVVEGAITTDEMSVGSLSAITADMGTLTAGTITMGTGTKDVDLDGFQIDEDELVGQEGGVDQVVLASSDGKITAGAGALVLDADGIQANSGNSDVNKLKIRDGSDTVLAMYGEVEDGVGTSGTIESVGKQAADPEGTLELLAKTYNGVAQGGVASVTITLETADGDVTLGGALRLVMGGCLIEMTEQSDPDAPGSNRGRLYVRDNGAGKTQLCVRFSTGAVQVIATEP